MSDKKLLSPKIRRKVRNYQVQNDESREFRVGWYALVDSFVTMIFRVDFRVLDGEVQFLF